MNDINNYFASHSRYNREVMVPRYNDLLKLLDSDYMQFRELVILWLCGACETFKLSQETRDLAVQLLDSYFCSIFNDKTILITKRVVSFGATISLVSAAKMINSYCRLGLSNFTDFNIDELIEFQIKFLQRLNFSLYPNITPSSCIDILLLASGVKDTKMISDAAGIVLTDFLSVRTSMLYTPSCIALCAITTAFTILDINSDDKVLKSCCDFERCLKNRQIRVGRRDAFINATKCKQTAVDNNDGVEFNDHRLVKVNGRYIDNEDRSDDKLDDLDESEISTICNGKEK